jgi:hypothetical protein
LECPYRLEYKPVMRTEPHLRVRVIDDAIVVSLPKTNFRVSYRMAAHGRHVVAEEGWSLTDSQARISCYEFFWLAWQAANDKAIELGWIAA